MYFTSCLLGALVIAGGVLSLVSCDRYHIYNQQALTWYHAYLNCLFAGGELASARSPHLSEFSGTTSKGAWLGGRIFYSWTWSDGSPLYQYGGCYKDMILASNVVIQPKFVVLDVFECFTRCPTTTIVALQFEQCMCLIDLPDVRFKMNDIGCSTMCAANINETCGNRTTWSLYTRGTLLPDWSLLNRTLSEDQCGYVRYDGSRNVSLSLMFDVCSQESGQRKMFLCQNCTGPAPCKVVKETVKTTWSHASQICRGKGMTLVHPVGDLRPFLNLTLGRPESYWVGLRRNASLSWVNGSTLDPSFYHIRPLSMSGICVSIAILRNIYITLQLRDCEEKRPFFCEFESLTTTLQPVTQTTSSATRSTVTTPPNFSSTASSSDTSTQPKTTQSPTVLTKTTSVTPLNSSAEMSTASTIPTPSSLTTTTSSTAAETTPSTTQSPTVPAKTTTATSLNSSAEMSAANTIPSSSTVTSTSTTARLPSSEPDVTTSLSEIKSTSVLQSTTTTSATPLTESAQSMPASSSEITSATTILQSTTTSATPLPVSSQSVPASSDLPLSTATSEAASLSITSDFSDITNAASQTSAHPGILTTSQELDATIDDTASTSIYNYSTSTLNVTADSIHNLTSPCDPPCQQEEVSQGSTRDKFVPLYIALAVIAALVIAVLVGLVIYLERVSKVEKLSPLTPSPATAESEHYLPLSSPTAAESELPSPAMDESVSTPSPPNDVP